MNRRLVVSVALAASLPLSASALANDVTTPTPGTCEGTFVSQLDLGNQVAAWKQIAEIWQQDVSHAMTARVPQISQSIAFGVPQGATGRIDPVYIEVANLVPGSRLEMVDISRDPDASFANPIVLPLHGADIATGRASVWLTTDEMQKLKLEPNHQYLLRAVAPGGVTTSHVPGQLRGITANTNVATLEADGQSVTRVVGPSTYSVQKPVVEWEHIKLTPGPNNTATLAATGAMVPGGQMRVVNLRTGATVNVAAQPNAEGYGTLAAQIADVKDDDLLLFTPTVQGVAGDSSLMHYDCEAPVNTAAAPH